MPSIRAAEWRDNLRAVISRRRWGGLQWSPHLNSSCDVRIRYRGNDTTTPERVLRAVRHDDRARDAEKFSGFEKTLSTSVEMKFPNRRHAKMIRTLVHDGGNATRLARSDI